MDDNNHKKENMSTNIAKKHIKICIDAKKIFINNQSKLSAFNNHSELSVFIATHSGELYRELGMSSGEDFWSLQLRSPQKNERLKNPDVIVTKGKKVEYFIEVKWGAVDECPFSKSDIMTIIRGSEKEKMKRSREEGGTLKCRGYAISNGQHFKSDEFTEEDCFNVNDETKFLLVSDFQMMKDVFYIKDYKDILSQLKEQSDIFQIADIYKKVDDVPSLADII